MASARTRTPVWTGLVFTLLLPLGSRAGAAESIETVQKAASEWAKLRTETVRLQTDWQWQRDTLESSLSALKARITTLEQERDTIQATIKQEGAGSLDLTARNKEANDAMTVIEQRLRQLTEQFVKVRAFLPPRLSLGLELPFRSIQDEKLGPAERMQYLVTIFNRCSAFNKSITLGEEPLALDGGENARLLEVIYWGLAYAYALDRAGNKAYYGHPGKDGWTWEPRPETAADVARMIEINQETDDPVFVDVPAQVSDPFAAAR